VIVKIDIGRARSSSAPSRNNVIISAIRGTPCSVNAPDTTGFVEFVRHRYSRHASETWGSMSAVEKAVAGQGDAEALPGSVVGLVQRFGQGAAVVAEALFDDHGDLDGAVGVVADHLSQPEADQLGDRGHGALPSGAK